MIAAADEIRLALLRSTCPPGSLSLEVLPVRVCVRVGQVLHTALDGPVDVRIVDHVLFGATVGEDRRDVAMEKVQQPVIDVLPPCPQLVNLVSERGGVRARERAAFIAEEGDKKPELVLNLCWLIGKPFQRRGFTVL